MASVYSVTQINLYIKNMFRQDFVLNKVSVKGEVSNCKYHTSGHIYFTVKDESGTLSAVMFAGQAKNLRFRIQEGQQIIVKGKIDVYERDGKYQFYVNEVKLDGAGDLYKRFEALKTSMEEMGMFAQEYKRKLPYFARKVGIVTAGTGAAVQDIINISKRRNPYVQLVLYPAVVQGETAKYSIAAGIKALDKMNLDVIIIGRGGGSIEDLWAFNEEIVAKAVFDCNTPVISAVGHETDFTIADFVADLRAPTPSAAAELAVADISQITERLESYQYMLKRQLEHMIYRHRTHLDQYKIRLNYLNPAVRIHENRQRIVDLENELNRVMQDIIRQHRHKLAIFSEQLNGLSPLNKLTQGYSYTESSDGRPVYTIKDVEVGEVLNIHISDGVLKTKITDKIKVSQNYGGV